MQVEISPSYQQINIVLGEGGGRREREDSPELLKMLWSFSKISIFVRVPTNFGQDCSTDVSMEAMQRECKDQLCKFLS